MSAPLLNLAARSAWSRRYALGLVALSIALATLLLVGLERLRHDLRQSFAQAVSGTDLVVGPRGAPVSLLLHAVFHIGQPTQPMRGSSLAAIEGHPAVAWAVPLALGDSHRGFAVLGTRAAYFERYRYAGREPLRWAAGRAFSDGAGHPEAVLGAQVAAALGYRLGQRLVLSHGDGAMAHNDHDDEPVTVVGVLQPTGTPVDRTVHISLATMAELHAHGLPGLPGVPAMPVLGQAPPAGGHGGAEMPPTLSAVLVGLRQRQAVFAVQRDLQALRDDPLTAALPGVALDELWQVLGLGERALQAVAALVALTSLAGLVAVVLAGLNERRRELAILRAVGAGPRQVLALLALEGGLVTAAGVAAGLLLSALAVWALAPWAQARWGLVLGASPAAAAQWPWVAAVLAAGWLASLVPGWRAYRLSLADGLSPRA